MKHSQEMSKSDLQALKVRLTLIQDSGFFRSCDRNFLRCILCISKHILHVIEHDKNVIHLSNFSKHISCIIEHGQKQLSSFLHFSKYISYIAEYGKKQFSTFHTSVNTFHASLNMTKECLMLFMHH